MTETTPHGHSHSHSHMWLVGALGMIAGIGLMIYVPTLEAVSRVVILFAGFHLVGALVLVASLYFMTWRSVARYMPWRAAAREKIDFGWEPAWLNGPWIAALIALSAAVAIEQAAPDWWPLAFLAVLLSAAFFGGFLFVRSSARRDGAPLPMVDWLRSDCDLVLDGGCGAGRTSLAAARLVKHGSIVALDRFDSDYIEGGGRALLERNLRIAGLAGRVRIETGDLTALPFADATFDSAVSAHAIDHLGAAKGQGVAEMFRVLKPGGRFLLVVWVPGWAMFAVANFLSFFLTRRNAWRQIADEAGFIRIEDGTFSGIWYLLLEKPS